MGLQPILIRRFLDTRRNRLVSPGLSMARCSDLGTIPLGAYFVVQIQSCIGYSFSLDANGNVPAANQDTGIFTSATGTPTFGVKTRTDALNGLASFAAYANGYASDYTDLAKGWVGIGGIFPLTVTPDEDYLSQVCLRNIDDSLEVSVPPEWLPVNLTNPICIPGSTGTPPSPIAYSGVATIPAGQDHVDVTVANLTVATGVLSALTQQDNGSGISTFVGTITANTLTITAGGNAPAGTYKIFYALASL